MYSTGYISWAEWFANIIWWYFPHLRYIGSPTAIGSATLTWRGRQLMQYVNGGNTYAYTYNDEGIRTSKTVNGVTHTYHLSGSQVVAKKWGNLFLNRIARFSN